MRAELHLDTKDIAQIVANYFNTDLKKCFYFCTKRNKWTWSNGARSFCCKSNY